MQYVRDSGKVQVCSQFRHSAAGQSPIMKFSAHIVITTFVWTLIYAGGASTLPLLASVLVSSIDASHALN